MLVWLTLPFYNFCGFRSVAVNSVYKLQFFYIYLSSVDNCKYLGRIISAADNDNLDTLRQMALLYAKTNMLMRKFKQMLY